MAPLLEVDEARPDVSGSLPGVSHKVRKKHERNSSPLGCGQSRVHYADAFATRANDLRIDRRPQKHTVSAIVPMPTDMGYEKLGAAITNGSNPTASAGGICSLNALRIAIEQTVVSITPTKVALKL
jgi:hypothetical protein